MPDPLVEEGREIYRSAVNQVLAGYQLIEEMLKSYIESHYDLVRIFIAGRLHFDFRREDYQDAALGRLVQVFSKICDNGELISELRSVVRHRDHIAHRALLKTYSEDVGPDEYVQLHKELSADMHRVRGLMGKVVAEHKRLGERNGASNA